MIGFVPVNIRLHPGEVPVKNGLCVTPADMERMQLSNRAISSHALDNFMYSDGTANPKDLPMVFRRGVDVNMAWELQKSVQGKMKVAQRAKNVAERSAAAANSSTNAS